ncbi:MAG: AraC family transcriptional regulator [Campylobacter sp.]|nr:AraC family transcriptional regulator [Campylobacter sp.]
MLKHQLQSTIDKLLSDLPFRKQVFSSIEGLKFYATDSIDDFNAMVYEPSICVILQGEKLVSFDTADFEYNPERYLLICTHIPARVKIKKASKSKPYISLQLNFSLNEIFEALNNTKNSNVKNLRSEFGAFFGDMNDELMASLLRLIELLDKPQESKNLFAPLLKKEILLNLILDEKTRGFLSSFALQSSMSNKILHIIEKIKTEFNQKLNIKQLASDFDISESSLYQNFKVITQLSPIAFQKKIRLQEAKNRLESTNLAVSQVAFDVGYESASQFSREYLRMFGISPKIHSEMFRAI